MILVWLWMVPSLLVARYAQRKGHNFWGFLVLGLVISWLVTLIVVLLTSDKRGSQGGYHLDQLQKLTELRDSGALTADEFEVEEARILQAREAT